MSKRHKSRDDEDDDSDDKGRGRYTHRDDMKHKHDKYNNEHRSTTGHRHKTESVWYVCYRVFCGHHIDHRDIYYHHIDHRDIYDHRIDHRDIYDHHIDRFVYSVYRDIDLKPMIDK
jgi:hypothetical protein